MPQDWKGQFSFQSQRNAVPKNVQTTTQLHSSHMLAREGEGKVKSLSCVRLFATPWTVAHQAPPSMGFSRREYLSGLPFPSPGDLPHPGIEPMSPALAGEFITTEPSGKFILDLLHRPWTNPDPNSWWKEPSLIVAYPSQTFLIFSLSCSPW